MFKYFCPSTVVAATFLALVLPADSVADGTGLYIEAGGAYGGTSDIDESFESDFNKVEWDTDPVLGAKLQWGWDFGSYRTDVKFSAYESGIDSVGGVSTSKDNYYFASATLNFYWDIHEFNLDKSLWEGAGVTPFVGLGGGVAGGYADATRSSDSKFNTKIGYGPAVRVNASTLLSG